MTSPMIHTMEEAATKLRKNSPLASGLARQASGRRLWSAVLQ